MKMTTSHSQNYLKRVLLLKVNSNHWRYRCPVETSRTARRHRHMHYEIAQLVRTVETQNLQMINSAAMKANVEDYTKIQMGNVVAAIRTKIKSEHFLRFVKMVHYTVETVDRNVFVLFMETLIARAPTIIRVNQHSGSSGRSLRDSH